MDIFTTGVLARVVQALPLPAPFILNNFFGEIQTEESEEIHFDVDKNRPRLAPFVLPTVPGRVVKSKGYTTNTFKPAYIKDKRVFTAQRALKRAAGEAIGGTLSPAQRMQLLLAQDLTDQLDMLTRRQEVMAIEALVTGKVTVKGEDYPEVVVDFGRHADLTQELLTTDRWGETDVDPLDDVEAWALSVTEHSGAAPDTLVMDLKAWKLFSASERVQKLLDRFRGSDTLASTVGGHGAKFMGNIGDYDIWVYTGFYEDPDSGALVPFLADHTVILASKMVEGVRAYGAIQDEEAGLQPLSYFAKSWLEKDPGVRYLLMQSAPLTVPYRVNASLSAKVR